MEADERFGKGLNLRHGMFDHLDILTDTFQALVKIFWKRFKRSKDLSEPASLHGDFSCQ
jgi:hypothetical protein